MPPLLDRFKGRPKVFIEEIEHSFLMEYDEDIMIQITAMAIFVGTIFLFGLLSPRRLKALGGEHLLNLKSLNDVILFKEVFLAYLSAAVLEPILAIGSMEEIEPIKIVIELFTLGSTCLWIWILTDAFDFQDVTQFYKYHVDIQKEQSKDPERYSWLKLKDLDKSSKVERKMLSGSAKRDIALWFIIACVGAPWLPGVVKHQDVIHAYVILFCWTILHHLSRRATVWSSGYLTTFIFPSTALMPLEYCLPLMDVADTVEDIEWLENYREFLVKRTGVELIIES
mmetsp:Transcript_33716/g.38402  ORF Transcript_33716/g.38402 Transcript_33716/m.38402 type:complete len:283 (+) Transcript_33716:48-896(+)|eukprot:CAMPEP_0194130754 /NCGR_PEP_ID=MMETSP0152-20130528/1723_1 /TAXON_ID=1049557 /ORGANISM="Thalassiothrix antarctica, Strain L6-D1" /LENGTH=282 /DNA_ID=CAMNT_0038825363 /DNA_START=38 /DNA_END=886 /DNA_ORIENTATION=+